MRRTDEEIREKISKLKEGLEEIKSKPMLELTLFSHNKDHQIELVENAISILEWVLNEEATHETNI